MRPSIRLAAAAAALAFALPAGAAPQDVPRGAAPVGPPIGSYVVLGVVGGVVGCGVGYGLVSMIASGNPLLFRTQEDHARVVGALGGTLMGAFLGVALTGPIWDAWTPPLGMRVVPAAGAGRGGVLLVGRF